MNSSALSPSDRSKFRSWFARPILTLAQLVAVLSVLCIALYGWPLIRYASERLSTDSGNGWLILLTLVWLLLFIHVLLFGVLGLISGRVLKLLSCLLLVGNSAALYFMVTYGAVLDRTMMGNVWNTDAAESAELLHYKLWIFVLVLGVAPAALIARVRIKAGSRLSLAALMISVATITGGWAFSVPSTWLWFDEYARPLGGQILPWSYVINTGRHLAAENRKPDVYELLPPALFLDEDPAVVVLVIGETARAANFSLYGYARNTNPELEKTNITIFKDALSCSTYTTASLQCMLSSSEDALAGDGGEPLPNYLLRHGVEVIWRTKNWGEPTVKTSAYERKEDLGCEAEECRYDAALLLGLEERIRASTNPRILIVLHQTGSHGPAYSTKYPPRLERFSPVCNSVDLSQCSQDALINAYDNTIAYTDQVLADLIGLLARISDRRSTMIYASDHGESLGENGLYLHGAPYAFAPDEQKKIPMLLWKSDWAGKPAPSIKECSEGRPCGHFDIFPMVLEGLGMRLPIHPKALPKN